MPSRIKFKTELDRKESRKKYHRDWQRKNKDKAKLYRNKEDVKVRRRIQDAKYKAEKRRNDPEFKEKEKLNKKKWLEKNKDTINRKKRELWATDNEYSKKMLDSNKRWYQKNKEKVLEKAKEKWKIDLNFKKEKNEVNKAWQRKNKNYIIQYRKKTRNLASEYERRKAREDPNFRIARSLRSRIRTVLRIQKARKSSSLYEIIGCSKNELKKHLESLFKTGMSWDNYGKWHIDHIKPCNSFNLIQEEEQKKAFNYKNLQPLWELENLKKSDKWEE